MIIARFIIPICWAEEFNEDPEQYVFHQVDYFLTQFRILELIKGHNKDYPTGTISPIFLYNESSHTADSTRWEGLLWGHVLVWVRTILLFLFRCYAYFQQAIRAIFFGSGLEQKRKGWNPVANIHEMTSITPECIVYAATQVRLLSFLFHADVLLRHGMCFRTSWNGAMLRTYSISTTFTT